MIKLNDCNEIESRKEINCYLSQLKKENYFLRNMNLNNEQCLKRINASESHKHKFSISINEKNMDENCAFIRRENTKIHHSKQKIHLKFNKEMSNEDEYISLYNKTNTRNKEKIIQSLECTSSSSSSCSNSIINDSFNSTIIDLSRTMKQINNNHSTLDNNNKKHHIPEQGTPSNKKLPLCYRIPLSQKDRKLIEFKH